MTQPELGSVSVDLTVEEADMIAKVLLQARQGSLGWVEYRPTLLSKVRLKIMRAAGLATELQKPE